VTAATIVGILAAAGTYLVLQRGLVRVALGFVLLGHAANVLLIASGGLGRRGVPIEGAPGPAADPLPQAFTLTAIVIGFGMTAFLLALAFRTGRELGDDDLEEDIPGLHGRDLAGQAGDGGGHGDARPALHGAEAVGGEREDEP
jgi:multicomponent Na+:H+ antiporter subunit C